MANEFFYSSSGDLRLAEVLAAEYRLLLKDRFSLMGHPAIFYAGNCSATGSTVIKVPLVGFGGYDRMSAVAENASTSNTAVTDASATITVARQALQRQVSDINDLVDSIGVNADALINDGLGSYVMRWMEMYASLVDDFSNTVGPGSGLPLTMDDFLSAQFTLVQQSVPGPYLCTLYPKQWTDLQDDLRGEVGPLQLRADVQDAFNARGQGIVATLNQIEIAVSSLVPTANAGADSAGGMHGLGAIAWADGLPSAIRGAGEVVFPAGQRLYTEMERDSAGALTKIVHNAFLGFAEVEDLRGVTLVSDR